MSLVMNPLQLIKTMSIPDIWDKLSAIPGGSRLFSEVLARYVPYSGSVKPEVLSLSKGHCEARLKDRRIVRNHLNSIHAAALMNFAELSSGLALHYSLPKTGRGILKRFDISYVKKARGELRSISNFQVPEHFEAEQDFIVLSKVFDASGDLVCEATATWKVST